MFAHRLGMDLWGKGSERRFFGDKHWNEPLKWARKAEADGVRRRVFCASMADVFEDRRDLDAERERLWALIGITEPLDWLLLTKRPENVARLVPPYWEDLGWPPNIWLGTTCENQRYADLRIPRLLASSARVHFLSVEPILGPVTIDPGYLRLTSLNDGPFTRVDWVITGGESGARARPAAAEWFRSLRDQCRAEEVAFHLKQAGNGLAKEWGCSDRAGHDPLEWPVDLQIQEVPA